MLKHHVTSLLLLAGLCLSSPIQANPPTTASMLANACAACHGLNGSSQGPATPSIAGISAVYFIDSMIAFQENERPATVMDRIAKGYSEEQIELMAEYFAQQPMIRTTQSFDPALASKGDALHQTHCEKCHENGGRASDDDAGILAGQKIPYLRYTLEDILNGKREVSVKMANKLKTIHKSMGQDGIEQLLNFYASQK